MAILYQDSGSFYDLEVISSLRATGSLFGTASYVTGSIHTSTNPALSASFAITASYVNYITGSGTTNRHSKFTAGNTIGDSLIFDDGTNLQITGSNVIISGSSTALIVTGSVRSLGGFTGSLFGTSSWSNNATTAINANTASTVSGITGVQGGTTFYIPLIQSLNSPGQPLFVAASGVFSYVESTRTVSATASFSTTASYALTSAFASTVGTATQVSNNLTQGTGITAFTYNGSSAQTVAVAGAASLTANELVKWNGTSFVDSNIADTGTNVFITASNLIVSGASLALIVTGSVRSSAGFTGSLLGTSSWSNNSTNASNASAIDVSVFGSPVDSYVLISNVAGTTGVGIGADADFRYNASTNVLTVGTVSATSLTGSLLGTSSWASNAINTQTSSYVNNLNQNLSITGSITVSGSSLAELFILGDQQITGSLRITNGVVAQTVTASFTGSLTGALIGTSSWSTNAITTQTASFLNPLSQSIITINTGQSTRFPGFTVIDSGSSTLSGSLIFDSLNNNWLFIHSQIAGGAVTSSLLIMGPETYNNIGNEQIIPINRVIKSQGDEHITGSNIFDDGTNIQITGSNVIISGSSTALIVTGSVRSLGGFTGSLFGTASYVTGSIHTGANVAASASFATTASYALNGGVTSIVAGTNVTISPTTGIGAVTINSSGGSGAAFPYTGSAIITGSLSIIQSGAPAGLIVTGSVIQQTGSAFFPTLNASESLSAGDFINITASFVRRAASNDTTKQAHGYVLTAVASGSAATIYYNGLYSTASAGITVGARYFLSTTGQKATTAPTTTGQLSQELGVGVSTTSMLVNIGPAIIT